MSLNGLDSADVQTAYQVAVVEAGGWYVSVQATRRSDEMRLKHLQVSVEVHHPRLGTASWQRQRRRS